MFRHDVNTPAVTTVLIAIRLEFERRKNPSTPSTKNKKK